MTNEIIDQWKKGVAPIKAEYLLFDDPVEPPTKKARIEEPTTDTTPKDADKLDDTKETKKRRRGQNKQRPKGGVSEAVRLCSKIALGEVCNFGDKCKFSHDIAAFIDSKEGDSEGKCCPLYENFGKCSFGVRCTFFTHHTDMSDYSQLEDTVKVNDAEYQKQVTTLNGMPRSLQKSLRTKAIKFERSREYLDKMHQLSRADNGVSNNLEVAVEGLPKESVESSIPATEPDTLTVNSDIASIRFPPREKKLIDFRHKTYLAPLTTVGNLPFRRICKEYGVDVTCGEMAHANALMSAQSIEWALTKRHPSENLFGIQIAANKPKSLVEACELLNEFASVDFVDLNLGCPIDSVFNSGGGSALLDRSKRLGEMVRGMDYVLDCPVTCKIRTGITMGKNIAHKVVPVVRDAGAILTTLHGRSRQQRYTKLADWEYIAETSQSKGPRMQFFGNGDILSWEEYYQHLEDTNLDGCMIGRGALIKPWIFEEIQSRNHLDPRPSDRMEIYKKFVSYGLTHWGSDIQGVNTTRRFLLEWQSFLYRYIPTGLLEVIPQKMNDRPPKFKGRCEMETLLASDDVKDWLKISEMFLGPTPPEFKFLPKHKANSYE
ncbi:hypothetical protein BKA69DRAFT_1028401 [Paraphysoderma sedebokerense]|nr:hypothetical protein BKA69DRAFT_1028401 [Paraphysoderma sedebokerense]